MDKYNLRRPDASDAELYSEIITTIDRRHRLKLTDDPGAKLESYIEFQEFLRELEETVSYLYVDIVPVTHGSPERCPLRALAPLSESFSLAILKRARDCSPCPLAASPQESIVLSDYIDQEYVDDDRTLLLDVTESSTRLESGRPAQPDRSIHEQPAFTDCNISGAFRSAMTIPSLTLSPATSEYSETHPGIAANAIDYDLHHQPSSEATERTAKSSASYVGTKNSTNDLHAPKKRRRTTRQNISSGFAINELNLKAGVRTARKEIFEYFKLHPEPEGERVGGYLYGLFNAIASGEAFCQLQSVLKIMRSSCTIQILSSAPTTQEIVQLLDTLETNAALNGIQRRLCLLRLYERSNAMERLIIEQEAGLSKKPLAPRLLRAQVIRQLTNEAYPKSQIDRSVLSVDKKRKRIQNQVQAGKTWQLLSEKFSIGVIALVPIGGQYSIQNSRIESLKDSILEMFVDVLARARGDFVRQVAQSISTHIVSVFEGRTSENNFGFETTDPTLLSNQPIDSPELLGWCTLSGQL